MPGDEITEVQAPVQLAIQNQTTIGGDTRSLKFSCLRRAESLADAFLGTGWVGIPLPMWPIFVWARDNVQ
jgi:hypothetical protein